MVKKCFFIGLYSYGFFLGVFISLIYNINKELPEIQRIEKFTPKPITIYDRNGYVLRELGEEKRKYVELKDIPKEIIQTVILLEDKRFYSHYGIDIIGIARATFTNLIKLRIVQGASTITQQMARNMFLSQEKTIFRKLKEILLAIKIEKNYSKEEILELYFNQIYYGNGIYGIGASSEYYFGKPTKKLTIEEGALLIGIPRSPVNYNPYANLELAIERRNKILKFMKEHNINKNFDEKKKVKIKKKEEKEIIAPYFVEEVKKWLFAYFGSDILYREGISIYTTIDKNLQEIAEKVLNYGLTRLDSIYKIKNDTLEGAIIVLNVKTGEILAEVGGRDFTRSMFNNATQGVRQTGSAFKPFIWLAAIENGYNPATIVEDEPITINIPGWKMYSPINYDGIYMGKITLRTALAHSRNCVSVRLIQDVTPEKVIKYAKLAGITSQLEPVVSLSLGCNSTSLLELTSAFATIANLGIRTKPYFVEKVITEDGKEIYENTPSYEKVISSQSAYILIDMMKSVLRDGTGGWASPYLNFTAAGKTGTTDEYKDAWFIGFTPSLICGVWVGFPLPKRIGRNATGTMCALPIWLRFMAQAVKENEEFTVPDGIVFRDICKKCGKLSTSLTKEVIKEVFIEGDEPKEHCYGH